MKNYSEDQKIPAPLLQNSALVLRPARKRDFSSVKLYRQDPENCRFIRLPESDADTLAMVEKMSQPWQLTQGYWNGLVICLSDNDTVIGEVAFNIEDWHHQRVEIGYRISNVAAGKGICTKAVSLLINYLCDNIGVHKIVAKCDPRNVASYKVMEKLGMKREAFFTEHYLLGDEWADQYDYGLLAANWQQ
ncbi:GNAT family N-acetyltransferase [Colwellia sp. RSH04]|uniref:GNAT family N-acetyltransferase n=1 Tax=Colwellia sp. RSH04 TaxID=2305464 RepID=UPI000E57A295|nr:GNAT family protein [Colwellia sp. RSH04]RHW74730.1 N-acetyltransferase [Colwellia sp. RSH04]